METANYKSGTRVVACEPQNRYQRPKEFSPVRDHAMERDSFLRAFSKTLGLSEVALKSLVQRMRGRYRALLREEVARTVEKADEINDELRYLFSALTAAQRFDG